ncbi:hypothetical protein LZ198_04695 [Myxococcus sp. K15C18031901]|uniref:hypothetical protein n=1 Tax=Myxococcus dinghuensis TaxID=2906761 RepID=UPI0020A6EEA4|nr:hypothetical protein [Myxococcus dinghuensis]MCP3098175.1 hypothetical protein [Myxococcus dinghuensis]
MENNFGVPPGAGQPAGPGTQAKEAVSIPAILLMVTSALTFLYALVSTLRPMDQALMDQFMSNPQLREFEGTFQFLSSGAGRFAAAAPMLVLNALTFVGALKMKSLQSYGMAMTGAIAALVPCCGPCYCLGLPLGIWALVVLSKPEVKARFT